jgi:hypothetical protein
LRQDLARQRHTRHAETLARLCDELMRRQRSYRIEIVRLIAAFLGRGSR